MPLSMSRSAPLLGICVLAVAFAAGPANAASPYINHFSESGTDTFTDFCGANTVDYAFDVVITEFRTSADDPAPYKSTFSTTEGFTNPLNGNSIIVRSAGQNQETTVTGDPDGIHVLEVSGSGQNQLVRGENGGVLKRDVGHSVFRLTFNGDELTNIELVARNGQFSEGFCAVANEQLGFV